MKYNVIFLIILMILIAVVVDRVEDKVSNIVFKEETENFMKKGGRNTADMGVDLCRRINILEIKQGIESTNCAEIYQ